MAAHAKSMRSLIDVLLGWIELGNRRRVIFRKRPSLPLPFHLLVIPVGIHVTQLPLVRQYIQPELITKLVPSIAKSGTTAIGPMMSGLALLPHPGAIGYALGLVLGVLLVIAAWISLRKEWRARRARKL